MRGTLPFVLALSVGCDPASQPVYQTVDVSTQRGAAVEIFEDAVSGQREEVFYYGGTTQTPLADYLFVVDNSSSMNGVVEKVRAGFASLAENNPFPPKAHIAIMGTTPSEPGTDLSIPHPVVKASKMKYDPGFLRLVDDKALSTYRTRVPKRSDMFPMSGCEAWFTPTEVNADGVPCIVAHTQIGMTATTTEAGLTSFKQILEKSREEPLFRRGAAVNVIFVSDTHDPGFHPNEDTQDMWDQLVAARPDFGELQQIVARDHLVASLRLHAIAPKTQCGESWSQIGPSYFEVVEQSGGHIADMCTTDDYAPLIDAIARDGAVINRGIFPLSRDAANIREVLVDGTPASFSVDDSGGVLVLDGAVPTTETRVEIRYDMAPFTVIAPAATRQIKPKVRGHNSAETLQDPAVEPVDRLERNTAPAGKRPTRAPTK